MPNEFVTLRIDFTL